MRLVIAATAIGLLTYTNGAAAFSSSARRSFSSASHLSMTANNYDESVHMNRRDAIARVVSSAIVVGNVGAAFAAEFSGGPTSDSDREPSVTLEKEPEATAESSSSFSPTAGGKTSSVSKAASPKAKSSVKSVAASDIDPTAPVIAIATALGATYAVGIYQDDTGGTTEEKGPKTRAPAPVPYGLDGGRNYYEGVYIDRTKPSNSAPATPPPPAPVVEEEEPEEEVEQPSWALKTPTPYGIENRNKNPYIKPIEEYCEKGKVDENCTDSIKSFVENVESTGTTVTAEEAKTIVGYLDSLTSNASNAVSSFATEGKSTTKAGFASYLDALKSESSVRPANGASAVKGYLDNLNGASAISFTPVEASSNEPAPAVEPAEVNGNDKEGSTVSADTTIVKSSGKGMGSYLDSMSAPAATSAPPSGKGMGSYLDSMSSSSSPRPSGKGMGSYLDALK